jgi:hypothetical protein
MAILYDDGKNALLTVSGMGTLQGNTNIKAMLIKSSYSAVSAAHVYADLSPHFATGLTAVTLTGCSVSSKTFDADDVTFPTVNTGQTINGVLVYYENGGTRKLLSYSDTGTGFPFSTNGANVVVSFSVTGVFTL